MKIGATRKLLLVLAVCFVQIVHAQTSAPVKLSLESPLDFQVFQRHTPDDTGTPELRAAQKSLVTDGLALAGPDTDTLGVEFREKNGRGIHFNPRGLQRHGELWAELVGAWLEQQLAVKPVDK